MINSKYSQENAMQEFIGQIVDVFEDYFSERDFGDTLVNPDREEVIKDLFEGLEDKMEAQEEMECLAVIYGDFYDVIGDEVWYLNEQFDSLGLNTPDEMEDFRPTFIEGVITGYKNMLERGRNDREIPEEDWQEMKDQISKLYDNWVIGEREEPEEER